MAATDQQMQVYCDQRVRRRAEQARGLVAALRDDKAAVDEVYARAIDGGSPWADARQDGPPKLLASADVLTFNAVATLLLKIVDGTGTAQDAADLAANWPAFMSACVQPVLDS